VVIKSFQKKVPPEGNNVGVRDKKTQRRKNKWDAEKRMSRYTLVEVLDGAFETTLEVGLEK